MTSNGRDRLEQIERLLEGVALRTADNTNAINGLIGVTSRMQEDFETFITVVRDIQADIKGLQTESVRIQQRLEEYIAQTNRRLERLEGNGEL